MTMLSRLREKRTGNLATAIPAISATQPKGEAATVARIATVAVATPTKAKSDDRSSSRNSTNSSSKPCEQKTKSRSWLLHFPDREPLTVTFSPPSTHAAVLDAYPAVLAAEPIEPGRQLPDTLLAGDQEAAVLAWLAAIGETDEAIVADVLTLCRQGEDARRYFLGRAVEISANDDRRCCSQCLNLLSGVCVVARPGGRVSAIRGHRPALPDMPQRCSGYSPNTRDTDQQTGREIGR